MIQQNLEQMAGIEVHKIVLELINLPQGSRCLDLGAGSGALLKELKERKYKVQGADYNTDRFSLKDIRCYKVNLNEKFPFKKNSFDLITCVEVIEHLKNQWNLIEECAKILRKDGELIISSPNIENIFNKFYYLFVGRFFPFNEKDLITSGHINPFFSWTLNKMIRNKFRIISVKYNICAIPLFNINFPIRNKLFGQVAIYKLRKI